MKKLICLAIAIIGLVSIFQIKKATAMVVGPCSNCHTMHNMENATAVVSVGSGAAWNASNELTGGDSTDPQDKLVISDCVGCHTSSTTSSVIELGDTSIPIVYNSGGAPTDMLAGGNFYWVKTLGDNYGHNVYGISNPDATLDYAPGDINGASCFGLGGKLGCHDSLALADSLTYNNRNNGCLACHSKVNHHGNDPAGQVVTAAAGYYRFLGSPEGHSEKGVNGIEDPNWEKLATSATHNSYYAGDDVGDMQSMGRFCYGCHGMFHSPGASHSGGQVDNGGGATPWLRHPADAVMPNSGDYANYTSYTPLVPVGRPEGDLTGFTMDVVRPGTDMVICLSCHRAHGSPYPSMLRWDYDTCDINVGTSADCGCFSCHSSLDGV